MTPRRARVSLTIGDITDQRADAIVNAANRSLLGGGGADGAVHRRGGPAILAACRALRANRYPDGLPTGAAVATPAGNLRATWVIHTVGPVYGRDRAPAALLTSCYASSLGVADELGARVVAFPAISTGAFGYPLDEAASIAIETVLTTPTKVDIVTFVLFDERAHGAFETALRDHV